MEWSKNNIITKPNAKTSLQKIATCKLSKVTDTTGYCISLNATILPIQITSMRNGKTTGHF